MPLTVCLAAMDCMLLMPEIGCGMRGLLACIGTGAVLLA